MPITLQTNARNASVDAATALMNGGSLIFKDSGGNAAATITLSSPAFGASSSGTAAAVLPLINPNCAGAPSPVATFEIRNSSNVLVLTGDVTNLSGSGSFRLSDLLINPGDRLEINTMTYTQPAS